MCVYIYLSEVHTHYPEAKSSPFDQLRKGHGKPSAHWVIHISNVKANHQHHN